MLQNFGYLDYKVCISKKEYHEDYRIISIYFHQHLFLFYLINVKGYWHILILSAKGSMFWNKKVCFCCRVAYYNIGRCKVFSTTRNNRSSGLFFPRFLSYQLLSSNTSFPLPYSSPSITLALIKRNCNMTYFTQTQIHRITKWVCTVFPPSTSTLNWS